MAMSARLLPDISLANDDGSCWTCLLNGTFCDARLPFCSQCINCDRECAGYHARLGWNAPNSAQTRVRIPASNGIGRSRYAKQPLFSFSSLGLAPPENRLLQHYIKNISRIALAVDYSENGYRGLVVTALNEPALLNAILAVSSSHLSRWQNEPDLSSSRYMRICLQHFHRRLGNARLLKSETTLVVMMFLLAYDAFLANGNWRGHYSAIASWLQNYAASCDLDPFVRSWLCMLDTQTALHCGEVFESHTWLDSLQATGNSASRIDPIYGCSTTLPRILMMAAQLQALVRNSMPGKRIGHQELRDEARRLQEELEATSNHNEPLLSMSVTCSTGWKLELTDLAEESQTLIAARAAAEVFRHATYIFIHRIVHDALVPPTPIVQACIDSCFELLTEIPESLGPGSMLGWPLVVVGAEVDQLDRRDFIRRRLRGLQRLCLNAGLQCQKVLEEVWVRRDLLHRGQANEKEQACSWQDVMRDIGIDAALF